MKRNPIFRNISIASILLIPFVILKIIQDNEQAELPVIMATNITMADSSQPCDLRSGTCKATLPNGKRIYLELEPKTIPILKPITVTTWLEGDSTISNKKLTGSVEMLGVDMEMGVAKAHLKTSTDNKMQTQVTLSLCVRELMQWHAYVTIEDGHERVGAKFPFDTVHIISQ